MEAIVTCEKHIGNKTEYFGIAEINKRVEKVKIEAQKILQLGDAVDLSNNYTSAPNKQLSKELAEKLELQVESRINKEAYDNVANETRHITEKMWSRLAEAAKVLLTKLAYSAPILIRYHNDIDGASGAYALYKAISSIDSNANIIWQMHKSIAYSEQDAETDTLLTNAYTCITKPLLLITDFGTSEESEKGIEAIREKMDIIWLDHHPVFDSFKWKSLKHYINPWLFGGDSNYTAGLLTCTFVHAFSNVDTRNIERASLIGDYSKYMKPDSASKELATVLDIATSDTHLAGSHNENLTPEAIDNVLQNEAKKREIIIYASNRMSDLLDNAISSIKQYSSGKLSIYVADFEKIRNGNEERYPLPGRFASKLMDKIEEENNGECVCVTILHFGPFISLRASKKGGEEINLLKVIEKIKEKYGSAIESAGGHTSAASIKLANKEIKQSIIADAISLLKTL